MVDRFVNLIGRNAKLLATMLICLIIANVIFQFFTHKTTALTAWKGGGFGMYTAPHPDGRTVWLELQGLGGSVEIRVYPENEELRSWINGVSLQGGAALRTITTQAKSLRHYPDEKKATALIDSVARIKWLDSFTKGVTPKESQTFKPEDIHIRVYEKVQDMQSGVIKRVIILDTSAGIT